MGSGFLGFETDEEAFARMQREAAARHQAAGGVSRAPPDTRRVSATGAGVVGSKAFQDPTVAADLTMRDVPQSTVPGYDFWQTLMRGQAEAPGRGSTYDAGAGQGTREQQMQLLAALQARSAGPSLAGMQGAMARQANARGLLGALGAGGRVSPGGVMGALNGGLGIARDTALGSAQEYLGNQSLLAQAAGGVRGGDIARAGDMTRFGIAAGALDNQRTLNAARMGTDLESAQRQLALERFRMFRELQQMQQGKNMQDAQTVMNTAAAPVAAVSKTGGAGK